MSRLRTRMQLRQKSLRRTHLRHVVVWQSQARSILPMREEPAPQETVVGAAVLEELDDAGLRIDGADRLDRAQLTPSDWLRDVHRK
eukprot:8188287-Heterocapsa_arctica.AAC.1